MDKQILSGSEALLKIKEGVDLVVNPVKSTISPNGRTVMICRYDGRDVNSQNFLLGVTKDGYRVSQEIDTNDTSVKAGVLFAKQVAEKQMESAGDATSTASLFAQVLLDGAIEEIDKGTNPVVLKKQIEDACDNLVSQLKESKTDVGSDLRIIGQVASTSANNDAEIGKLISDAYEKIGNDGVIKIERSKGVNTTVKITGGMTFGKGWASQHFVNSPKGICTLLRPYILVADEHIVKINELIPILEKINQENNIKGERRGLMIFCDRSDGEALATLVFNHQKDILNSCVVQMDFLGEKKIEFMKDIAAATGAKFISENTGGKLETTELSHLGCAETVEISKDETTIVGGHKDEISYDLLISTLKELEEKEEDEYLKDLLRKRIARLKSSVAVISVGGTTEVEVEERVDRVDDAVRAVRCAIEEGYVAGGGSAFLRCKETGNIVVDKILTASLRQICENSGTSFDFIYKNVIEKPKEVGYNAKSNAIENLFNSGIIEPVKSNRCALQNAVSVVCAIISSKYLISDKL